MIPALLPLAGLPQVLAGVGELVDFIEDHDGFPHRAIEAFGITQTFGDTGQIAVEVFGVR